MNSLFNIGDTASKHQFVLSWSQDVYARVLTAGVAETINVPTGAAVVVFSATANFFVKPDGVASVPAGDIEAVAPELNPGARKVSGVSQLSVISAVEGAVVTAAFYGV